MARYTEQLSVDRTEKGKRFYLTVIPQDFETTDFSLEYVSRLGDRWDSLAYKFYGRASMWYTLANANSGLNGSIFIQPGTKIKVPEV
jgi:phage tail protein X